MGSKIKILTLILFLVSLQSSAAFFNNRVAVQGYLKQGSTPLNDATGYSMRFLVKQNSTVVWCQDSASSVPVVNGIFTSVLSGNSNCQSLSNAFDPTVFTHAANTDVYTVDVVVDLNKDGFGGADDATFAGISLVSSPMAMICNQANTALTATTATSATNATNATNATTATTATTAGNVTGVVAIANGGTGAASAAAARTALGLGGLATVNTSGAVTDFLRGDGTWGSSMQNNATDPSTPSTGQVWYNSTTNVLKYYDGTTVRSIGVAGAGLNNFNGLTASTQTLAIGTTGTAPAWSSAASTHTLNIPMASTTSVTAGLISKTEYNLFNSKLSSTLASGNIFIGNSSNVAAGVSLSGDATISNAGLLTIDKTTTAQANKILSLDGSGISISAGHQFNGSVSGSVIVQAAGTTTSYSMTLPPAQGGASQVLANNGSGTLSWMTPMDLSNAQTVGGAKTFSSAGVFQNGLTISAGGLTVSGGSLTLPSGASVTTSAGALTVTAATNLTAQSASGSTTTLGNTGGASATVIQAGTGKVKIGSTGTAFTASGVCSVASTALATTETNVTCTGVPASTAVAVSCSPGASLSAASALYARATGTVNQIAIRGTVAATAVTWTCMWMQ